VQSKNLVKAFTYNNFMPEEKPIPRWWSNNLPDTYNYSDSLR
jgi:hypothetical protein